MTELVFREPAPLEPAYSRADMEVDAITAARLRDSVPENTRLAYERIRNAFEGWCRNTGRVALPATDATLTAYVSAMITAGYAPSTIGQAIGGIRKMHRVAGYPGRPDTEASIQLLRGYRRERAANGDREDKAPPILPDTLRTMIGVLDLSSPAGMRDRLVLILGFTMMARRSELGALQLSDVRETEQGIEITLRTSKTDKESKGAIVAIPPASHPELDPVRLVRDWKAYLAGLGITDGPLLRRVTKDGKVLGGISPASINSIVRRLAVKAKLPDAEEYCAHGLRAGGMTASLQAGIPLGVAATHGRWSPKSPVVIGYARAADQWRDNAMRGVL